MMANPFAPARKTFRTRPVELAHADRGINPGNLQQLGL